MRTATTADRWLQHAGPRPRLVLLAALAAYFSAGAQAQLKPAQVLSLSRWSLQTPIPDGSSARIVRQPELRTYSSSNFYAKDDSSLTPQMRVYFATPADGATIGSSYPRTELREMATDGTTASWSLGSSTVRTMTFSGAVTQLAPGRRRVCIAQVKGNSSEPLEVMVEAASCASSGTSCSGITIKAWLGDNESKATVAGSYSLGTKYTIGISAGNKRIKITYNGAQVADYPLPSKYLSGNGNYFKVGNYLQSNTNYDSASARSVVWVSDLSLNSP